MPTGGKVALQVARRLRFGRSRPGEDGGRTHDRRGEHRSDHPALPAAATNFTKDGIYEGEVPASDQLRVTCRGGRAERLRKFLTLFAAALVLMAQARPSILNRQLLVVLDGLRPDYVRPDIMPNLCALGQRGVIFQNHHSVYPTVTRVNASSIATGTYPATHGVMGNSVFFPAVDATRFLDTGDRANLLKINESEKGRLQTATTMGEILQRAGRKMLVVSSGSSGSAYLLNYHVAGGAILHNEFTMPGLVRGRDEARNSDRTLQQPPRMPRRTGARSMRFCSWACRRSIPR